MSIDPADFTSILGAAPDPATAAHLAELRTRLADARHHPSVIALTALQPPALHAQFSQRIIEAAGGRPALDDGDVVNTWDDVAWVQPEMLVLALPSLSLDDAIAAFVKIADLAVWRDLPATYLNQIYIVDIGTQPIDAIEMLAGLLHPDRCTPPTVERARRVSPLVRVELRNS